MARRIQPLLRSRATMRLPSAAAPVPLGQSGVRPRGVSSDPSGVSQPGVGWEDSLVTRWAVIVAVKPLHVAKSRLDLPKALRGDLVVAMLVDTLTAAAAVPGLQLLVVTDDSRIAAVAAAAGVTVRGGEPSGGLNEALSYGEGLARSLWGDTRIAALPGDVPSLIPAELAAALTAASACDRALVVDADREGTTLLCAASGLRPSYGVGSAGRHEASGCVPLAGDWPGLRRDVDTLANLSEAARTRLGSETTALLGSLPFGSHSSSLPSSSLPLGSLPLGSVHARNC